ncbi:MAG: cell division protein FtsW [Alphaproteobacteria bacterium]|nr:cell division protein FtsW [Alphaproteobacteria bacterium]
MKVMTRTDKSVLNSWWWSIDRLTLIILVVIAVVGIMMVTAASPSVAERLGLHSFYFVTRQIVFLVLSMSLMFGISMMGRKAVWRTAFVMLVVSIILMALAVLFGASIKGATRWVSFMGVSIQPSELVKPAFAVTSAWLMAHHRHKGNFPGHQMAFGLCLLILCLLLLQPDIGMSVMVSCIWGAQVFLSGLPMFLIILLFGLGVLGLFGAYMFFPHVANRVDRFLDPAAGDNYQVQKSLDAFGNGGLFGTGPGHGQVKMTLPDAHADFIFAVMGEEFGMLVAISLVFTFCFIIIRGINRIYRSEDMFIILATVGILVQFGLQSLIHMGSSLQLLPAKGMTLPFISYGGSSLLAMGFSMGILLALTRKQKLAGA